MSKEIRLFFPIKPIDYGRFLVISLGTGSPKLKEKYNADEAATWGVLGSLNSHNSTPLGDIFTRASSDLVDLYVSTVFQALHAEKNYLRIQDDKLSERLSSVDIATEENLNELVKAGEALLKKPVSMVNLDTGVCEPTYDITNEQALTRVAIMLSRERKARKVRLQIGKSI